MAKIRRKIIIVEGSGLFPIDMLRYDHAWPRTEADANKCMYDAAGEMREIELCTDVEYITVERWNSFTWNVKSVRFA